jgi:ribosomal protein S18 acetylase RimI-like enzyme
MSIRFQVSVEGVDWNAAVDLVEAVGWGRRDPAQMERGFSKSKNVFAFDNDSLVGMGRCITDGEYYATLWDIIVKPGYQKRGIGRKIVKQLLKGLEDMQFVALTSTEGNESFYAKFGFKIQKTAMLILNIPGYPEDEVRKLINV